MLPHQELIITIGMRALQELIITIGMLVQQELMEVQLIYSIKQTDIWGRPSLMKG